MITTPYATATYVVTSQTVVSERDLAVLRSPAHEVLRLQTSTVPPSHRRIIVSARLEAIRVGAKGGYRDMHYFGGLLSILGFTAAERDAAFMRKRPDGSESGDVSQQ